MAGFVLNCGVLVAFEGIDGAGKTTQARLLRERLVEAGFDVVSTKEPTNGPHGQAIRASAQNGRLPVEEELRLFMLDRQEHVEQLIKPAVQRGDIVIVDRYYLSTVAYQGARGMDPEELRLMNEAIAPVPDLLVILDVEPDVGLARIRGRGDEADLFENRDALAASRAIFNTMTGSHVLRLDAGYPIEELAGIIAERLWSGPLASRMGARDHLRASVLERTAGIGQAIDDIVANPSLAPGERLNQIREAAYAHAPSDRAILP